MEKVKKSFWKCVDFVYKHKVISFSIAFVIATSLILFNVFANDDDYANKLVVTNASITAIDDGGDDESSLDNSHSNGIIRNFDTITYSAKFKLYFKQGISMDPTTGRNVVVDVIVPNTIDAVLSTSSQGEGTSSTNLDENYRYFEFVVPNLSTDNDNLANIQFSLSSVNGTGPGAAFEPIVLIKEATDENQKALNEMTAEEKEQVISNIASYNKMSCDSNSIHCSTTTAGAYNYNINFYPGSYNNFVEATNTKKFPIGIGVEIDQENLLGVYIPSSIKFTIGATFDGNKLTIVDSDYVNYRNENSGYTIFYEENHELPNIQNGVSKGEGNVVTISGLKYDPSSKFIGTAAFELSSTRASGVETDETITITSSNLKVGDSDTVIKATGGSKTITDYYEKFIGAYKSQIDIYANGTGEPLLEGNAFLNYGQSFKLEEAISYGFEGVGDALDELDTFIKIDPTAFAISSEDSSVSGSGILKYGHGDWTSQYFTLNNISGCPTGNLSKEEYMNLYGGPCLTAKDTVVWSNEEEDLPIIIVQAVFGDKDSAEDNVNENLNETITLYGSVKGDVNLANKSYQITTMATGIFEGQLYYMSKNPDQNDITNASKKDNYKKSVYDFANRNITTNNVNPCNDYKCNIAGDTVHVMGFSVNKPTVKAYLNDIERTVFTDYPIEWRIDSSATSNDPTIEYDTTYVKVVIPESLNFLYAETTRDGIRTQKQSSFEQAVTGGIEYTYTFTSDEITDGSINTLSIFTDIPLDTKSGTEASVLVFSNFEGKVLVVNQETQQATYVNVSDARPLDYSFADSTITLKNDSNVTTYGNARPRYIEANKPFTYTMKSYNNSSTLGDTASGYAYNNATMYYVLPYIEDINYKIYGKKFSNTSFKIKLTEVKEGYTFYYTKDSAKNVNSDIYNVTSPDTHTTWTQWTNPTTEVEATAIKIVKNTAWDIDTYFYSQDGVVAEVTPIKNKQADAYYSGFTVAVDRPEGFVPDCNPEEEDCSSTSYSSKIYFLSPKSLVEVYSRQVSGFVFEDYNYSDMYENGEEQLENIIVELYKLNNEDFTVEGKTNPNAYIDTTVDELVDTTTTDEYGAYTFTGIPAGNYYVLFRYDGDKYTPSDKYGGEAEGIISDAKAINSKAVGRNNIPNEAVSDIIVLVNESANERYMNLGLRIRKDFGVEINKYITSVEIFSNQGTKKYEYDKATKVNIDIKNLKNTKFRVTYSFDIVNTKYFPGYIGYIVDLMPVGMTFDNSLPENADWALYDGMLYYTGLQNKLLLPGEKQYFQLVLDLDTNIGGTYLNIVAAQQPILMGDDTTNITYGNIDIDVDDDTSGDNPDDSTTGDNNPDEGNGE